MLHDRGRQRAPDPNALLAWCCMGSLAAHLLLLYALPGWRQAQDTPPQPLNVELRQPPAPEIVPPKPLPPETRPLPREQPKPVAVKPEPVTPLPPRDERPPEPPRAPALTAPPEAPPAPATFAVPAPEAKPAPPPEPPRLQPPPAPVTPPRSDAAYLNNPKPQYPLAARRRGDHGTVLVRVLVTAEGTAASVNLEKSSGFPALDEAAVNAVKSWRFVPARQGTQAVEAPYVVPVVFKLD